MAVEVERIYEFDGSGETLCYQARGHLDPEAFVAGLSDWDVTTEAEHVAYRWYRNVPMLTDDGAMRVMTQHPARPGSRGAYEVTEVSADLVRQLGQG